MMKKLLNLTVIVVLFVTLLPLVASAQEGVTCQEEVVVQKGDWLSKIADKYYGNPLAYPAIMELHNKAAEADPAKFPDKIDNADVLEVGWKICVPTTEDAEAFLATYEGAASALPNLEGREVVVAVENAYPPYNFIDANSGEPAGWDYDAWNAICGKLNCKATFKETAWEGIFEAAAAGEFDVAADGITITEERKKKVAFSDPYMQYGQVVMVRFGEEEITDKDSLVTLTDKMVGVQLGTTNEATALELVGEARVKSYDDFAVSATALIAGDVDAVILDSTAASGFVAQQPDKLKIAGEKFTSEELGFVFQQGSDLIAPTNAALAAMKADGSLDALYKKWFEDYKP